MRQILCSEINKPLSISVARNKLSTFLCLYGKVNIVPWTIEKRQAQAWLDEKSIVFGNDCVTIAKKGATLKNALCAS